MTYWKTQHFKAMQNAWYAKLKVEGFEDIEEIVGGELVLRQSATHPYRGLDELRITSKETYYRLLGQKIETSTFNTEVDRLILTCFAIGTKIKDIIRILEREGKGRCRGTIRFTIRKYEMAWGLREYTPQQLNKAPRTKSFDTPRQLSLKLTGT